tara:strand:- start:15972 stop:17708 length:1737 start_codon:yes stop_codon:yes gene_type:complete
MNSAILAAIGLAAFYAGFRYYSNWLHRGLYKTDPELQTPSHEFQDNIDFVPTKRHILFGHHFTSIAGAAPIIGPCVAAYWGWFPACLWIILGSIFVGAAHDFGALIVSLREKGRSIADISSKIMGDKARIMFLLFVLMFIWLVLAVFAMAIADLFVTVPSTVIPINVQIVLAISIGWLIYKKGTNTFLPSIIALILLYLFIWVGSKAPISFEVMGGLSRSEASNIWIIVLFIYSGIASLLPVWFLLQPRDYINSHQLLVGLGLLYIGIFYVRPIIEAPAIRLTVDQGAPPMLPLLFVTIACGAISGFHGLVASGTTSKQVGRIKDARLIGYGSMLGEGTLALASTIAAVAGISLVAACNLPTQGNVQDLSWAVYYDTWANASGNKAAAFVLGGGALIQELGIPSDLAKTLMAVLVISFAATTLDTATRIQRFVLSELGTASKVKILENRYFATVIAILPAFILTMWNVDDPVTGSSTQAGWILWPIFGASNQMLAAFTFMVLTLYFWQLKRPVLPIFIPMILVMLTTLITIILKTINFAGSNPLLFLLCLILILLIGWMIMEGLKTIKKSRFNTIDMK